MSKRMRLRVRKSSWLALTRTRTAELARLVDEARQHRRGAD